jgi:hypothetical protein
LDLNKPVLNLIQILDQIYIDRWWTGGLPVLLRRHQVRDRGANIAIEQGKYALHQGHCYPEHIHGALAAGYWIALAAGCRSGRNPCSRGEVANRVAH